MLKERYQEQHSVAYTSILMETYRFVANLQLDSGQCPITRIIQMGGSSKITAHDRRSRLLLKITTRRQILVQIEYTNQVLDIEQHIFSSCVAQEYTNEYRLINI